MNRTVSAVLALVILALAVEAFDARTADSSSNAGKKQVVKRRSKRDAYMLPPAATFQGPCNYADFASCDQIAARNIQVGMQFQKTINYVQQRKLFVSGLVSMSALQSGGMCVPNTNFFNANAFSALVHGHVTMPQLWPLRVLPVPSIDLDGLVNAAYVSRYGQYNALTGLGVMANLFGHILPSQLRPLSLYPMPREMFTSSFLQQAGYLHSNCLPTALGLAASYIHYLPNDFASLGCQAGDDFSLSLEHLVSANYVYGTTNLVTAVGFAAMQSGFVSRETYQNFGCYPFFSGAMQTQSSQYVYQEQSVQTVVSDLTHAGYLYSNGLLSHVAYYGISKSYFSIENFRALNLWPCANTHTLSSFVAAGYASYSGHLTTLGTYLYHAQYFSAELLQRIGIQYYGDSHFFHHVLNYGGYVASSYHETHAAVHSTFAYPAYGVPAAAQVGQYQSVEGYQSVGGQYQAASAAMATGAGYGAEAAFVKK